MELSVVLGRNLKRVREARGMTQAEAARVAGLPRATWANLESGLGNPTLSVLNRLASAYRLTFEELLGRAPAGAGTLAELEARVLACEKRLSRRTGRSR